MFRSNKRLPEFVNKRRISLMIYDCPDGMRSSRESKQVLQPVLLTRVDATGLSDTWFKPGLSGYRTGGTHSSTNCEPHEACIILLPVLPHNVAGAG